MAMNSLSLKEAVRFLTRVSPGIAMSNFSRETKGELFMKIKIYSFS